MTAVGGGQARDVPAEAVPARSERRWPVLVRAACIFVLATLLWGGYLQHWSWIGISGHTATLWDWLNLLLLPLAVSILPIWVKRSEKLTPRHKSAALGVGAALGLTVVLGYAIPWAWTGFRGNTLWDWLELLALPLAVVLIPAYNDLRKAWRAKHTAIALAALAVALVPVLGGYLAGWAWTGFRDNTLWDWLHLLLLPLVVPVVLVPVMTEIATAGLVDAKAQTPTTVAGEAREQTLATVAGEAR